jgi:hypothetical protein
MKKVEQDGDVPHELGGCPREAGGPEKSCEGLSAAYF